MDKHILLNRSVENLVLHASVYARSRPEHWRNCASHLCWSDCAGSLKATGQSPHRREASSMRCPPPVGTLFVYTQSHPNRCQIKGIRSRGARSLLKIGPTPSEGPSLGVGPIFRRLLAPRRLMSAHITFNLEYIFYMFQARQDTVHLFDVIDFERGANDHPLARAAHMRGNGNQINAEIRDHTGNITNQASAITGGNDEGRQVTRLTHAGPIDVDEPLAITFAHARDIFTVHTMHNDTLAPADKT